jgi:hypothetical protein
MYNNASSRSNVGNVGNVGRSLFSSTLPGSFQTLAASADPERDPPEVTAATRGVPPGIGPAKAASGYRAVTTIALSSPVGTMVGTPKLCDS